MKKLILVFLLVISPNIFSQSYPHISELNGLEDSQGNTHLFYRYVYPSTSCWSKNIYHLDIVNNIDTFFIWDSGGPDPIYGGCEGDYVNDYEFFNNDPAKFIYAGYSLWIDPVALLRRYDGEIGLEAFGLNAIEISRQDENLVYVSAGDRFFKSSDGGYNFERNDSMQLIDESIISLGKYNDSHIYGINDSKLMRSENDGMSYEIVDDSEWLNNSKLFYDVDQSHIYGLSVKYNFSTQSYSSNIYVSNNNGDPFTWSTLIELDGKVWMTIDEINSGEIYYSQGKQIYKSIDYGNTFTLYKELDMKITGLYKKSSSNIIYASTPLKIYEITSDTIQVIKSLPIPEEVLNYYPLATGNHWVYSIYTNEGGNNIYWGDETRTIVDVPVNNFEPEVFLSVRKLINGEKDSTYIKVDSLSGKLYASSTEHGDYLFYENLLAEAGDTVCYEYNPVWNCQLVQPDSQFTGFGLNTTIKKYFPQAPGWYFGHSLVQGIGLYKVYNGDLTTYQSILKGCIIDGIIYGDTTTVGVEYEAPIANEFKLEQNFPNPFNPNTVISYRLPVTSNVTLNVYDILGNEIATLVNEEKPAGEYEVEFQSIVGSRQLTSGIYFYQLKAGSFIQTKKMILLK
jgi:hypothetical protein